MITKTARKALALVLALILIFSCAQSAFASDSELIEEGTLNEDGTVTYKLYVNGDLIISGAGAIDNDNDDDAYGNYSAAKRIIINEGITSIGSYCFSYCENVTEITLPESLEVIEPAAFRRCSIEEIYIPKNVRLLGSDAFFSEKLKKFTVSPDNQYFCSDENGVLFNKDKTEMLAYPAGSELKSYSVPEGVVRLNDSLFYYAGKLEAVTIAQSVRSIGEYIFSDKLWDSAQVEDNIVYYGDIAIGDSFDWDEEPDGVIDVRIKDGTRLICQNGFERIDKCKLYIPASVVAIGDCSFEYYGVEYVNIPACVEHIGAGAFKRQAIAKYNVDENNRFYSSDAEGTLFNKDKTTLLAFPRARVINSYTVPETVKEIGENAFEACPTRYILLPRGLETIGDFAFYSSSLVNLDIPDTVKTIKEFALSSTDIRSIVIPKSVEYIGEFAICDIQSVAILNDKCVIEAQDDYGISVIVGYDGSTAQVAAADFGCSFASISDGHKHIYFPASETCATCTEDGSEIYSCPCGKSESVAKPVRFLGHAKRLLVDDNGIYYALCMHCGEKTVYYVPSGLCDCVCHKYGENVFYTIVCRFILKLWRLFNINSVCECGVSHY